MPMALAATMTSTIAQAECWTPTDVEAAQVRSMETMLMVGSLKCRNTPDNFITQFNGFVRTYRPALLQANEQLRQHFASVDGPRALDSFVTSIANRYGDGSSGLSCQDMRSILDEVFDAGDSFSSLVSIARSSLAQPKLPESRCPTAVTASRQ